MQSWFSAFITPVFSHMILQKSFQVKNNIYLIYAYYFWYIFIINLIYLSLICNLFNLISLYW